MSGVIYREGPLRDSGCSVDIVMGLVVLIEVLDPAMWQLRRWEWWWVVVDGR